MDTSRYYTNESAQICKSVCDCVKLCDGVIYFNS